MARNDWTPRRRQDGTERYYRTVELTRDPVTGQRRQKKLSAPSWREGDQAVARLLVQDQQGKLPQAGRLTVGAYLERWLQHLAQHGTPCTAHDYARRCQNHLIPDLGHLRLSQLSPMLLQEYFTRKLQAMPEGGRQLRVVLSAACHQAIDWQLLDRNPCQGVRLPAARIKPRPTLTRAQYEQVWAAARTHPLGLLWQLELDTGLRRGELLALRWDDLDLERRLLRVVRGVTWSAQGRVIQGPKSEAGKRILQLPQQLVDQLKHHRPPAPYQGLVFPGPTGGLLWDSVVQKHWKRFLRQLGLPDMRFHDLRHTHGTLLLEQGESLKLVQHRLGHASIVTTANRYLHVTDELQTRAMERWDAQNQGKGDQTVTKPPAEPQKLADLQGPDGPDVGSV
jgi:integrase